MMLQFFPGAPDRDIAHPDISRDRAMFCFKSADIVCRAFGRPPHSKLEKSSAKQTRTMNDRGTAPHHHQALEHKGYARSGSYVSTATYSPVPKKPINSPWIKGAMLDVRC
jgi:hypothetical protein